MLSIWYVVLCNQLAVASAGTRKSCALALCWPVFFLWPSSNGGHRRPPDIPLILSTKKRPEHGSEMTHYSAFDHLMSHTSHTSLLSTALSGQRVEVIQPDHTMPKVLLKSKGEPVRCGASISSHVLATAAVDAAAVAIVAPSSSPSYSSMPSTPREKDEERSPTNVRAVMPEAVSLPEKQAIFHIFYIKYCDDIRLVILYCVFTTQSIYWSFLSWCLLTFNFHSQRNWVLGAMVAHQSRYKMKRCLFTFLLANLTQKERGSIYIVEDFITIWNGNVVAQIWIHVTFKKERGNLL